ncbi:MAG: glycosyltransferase family 2 protein [Hyphomicrobium sp.]
MPPETAGMNRDHPIDVSILVVSYNTRALTLAAIASAIRETAALATEIIVVDNASTDGSAAAIAEAFPSVRLVASATNLGFARANNLAARFARGRFLLLLNPDTVVLDRAVERLHAFALARPSARIWGGRTLFADGRLNPASCWGRMTPWNLLCRATGLTAIFRDTETFNGEAYGGWSRDSLREVDIVSGCFLMIERAFWSELGGFDPAFFMYGEEADLCLRGRTLGARPAVTPDATIVHLGGASETARTAKMVKLLSAKAALVARHFHPATRSLGSALLTAWPLSRLAATAARAAFTGNAAHRDAAATWREIWRQRDLWRHGYRKPAAASASIAPAAADASLPTPRTRF